MKKALVVGGVLAALALGLPVVAVVAMTAGPSHEPSAAALDDIPREYLVFYREAVAERCRTLPWSVLAGVGKVESDHGRLGGGTLIPDGSAIPSIVGPRLDGRAGLRRIEDTDGGRYDGDVEFDRAAGPMQFLPLTWAAVGLDASGDGIADPHDARDAIHAVAAYLCEHGAGSPSNVRDALLAYNRSPDYVDRVLNHAARYASRLGDFTPADPELIVLVLNNSRLDIHPAGRNDIAAGRIDPRVLTILQLASVEHTLSVSSLRSGHSRCVSGVDYPGCRVSHHWHGRAVDIAVVDGSPVHGGNGAARDLVLWLADLPSPLRPDEVGMPWNELAYRDGLFADSSHSDHVHVGYGRTVLPVSAP